MYVPRDEKFRHSKLIDFLADTARSVSQGGVGLVKALFDTTPTEFDSLQDVLDLSEKGIKVHHGLSLEKLKGLLHIDEANTAKFPMPDIIKEDKTAWRTDEDLPRQMLAGLHPLMISRLEEFPPVSKLDPKAYGNQNSSITKECIEENLNGLTLDETSVLSCQAMSNHTCLTKFSAKPSGYNRGDLCKSASDVIYPVRYSDFMFPDVLTKLQKNENSRDRAPGLGTETIEPADWHKRFCEVWDTGLREFVLANFGDPDTGLVPWGSI